MRKPNAWITAAISIAAVAAIVWANNGPQPSVGLYWFQNSDPTAGGGVSAPQSQLLIRTDEPSIYYKSGAANTAWTLIGQTSASGGGTVTRVDTGTGLTGGPITTIGTVTLDITPTTCTAGTAETATASNGTSTCSTFFNVAGTALSASGSTINLDITPTTCTAGTAETATAADGTSSCSTFFNTAGTGLTSSGSTASLNINGGSTQTCASGNAVTSTTATGIQSCSPFLTSSSGVVTSNVSFSSDFGPGTDGNVTCFDGTSVCLGITPSSSTYTLARSIYPANMSCSDGVRIKSNGFQIFVAGVLTGGTATPCQIDDNGASATSNSGAAPRGSTGWYGATAGGASTGGTGTGGTMLGAPFTNGSTQTGGTGGGPAGNGSASTGVCAGGGGGGQSVTNSGGGGGNVSVYPLTSMNPLPIIMEQGVGGRSFGSTTLSCGSGGGGGGGAAANGGGGAGGGIVYVNARKLAGKLTIEALGGNGANAIASGGGGGGGGGGGCVWVEYVTNAGTLTASAAGGTHGTGLGGGGNGGDGTACQVFRLNLSGDGT